MHWPLDGARAAKTAQNFWGGPQHLLVSPVFFFSQFCWYRVAQSAGIGGLDPSIAKDLIDSEDPKHTLFCRKIAFVAIYALFRDDISIL